MYTSHYGLTAKPFSIVPDPNVLFLSKNHENALTYLEYGLSEKVGFILLTGEVGIGKTTLIRHMLNKMSSQMDIAVIFNTNFSSDQLFRRILSEFELPCDTADKSLHLETLYHFLIDQFARGRHTLLIIDEAQNLSDEVLEDIRMLFNLQTDNHILLQILLVGQPDLKRRMSSPKLRQLAQRIVVNYHLSPLSKEQTYQYINYRLHVAGAAAELFSPGAMALIYEKSGGIPRTINLLCDAGLVYGYGENKTLVDREIIKNVLKDRICLTAAAQEQQLPAEAVPLLDEPAAGLIDRVTAIETALADLQFGQEKFMREIRSEVDRKLQDLEDTQIENGLSSSLPDEEDKAVASAGMDNQPNLYTFKDSAVAHTLEFENEHYPHETVSPDSVHQYKPVHTALKPRLSKIVRKKIVPYLDITYTWMRRNLSHKYALWVILLMVPLAGLWAMSGGDAPSSIKYVDQTMDSAPPPDLVSLSYEDDAPSLKMTANNRQAASAPSNKEEKVIIHTIQSGETLLSIARHYGVPAKSIKHENNISNSHLIYVGQTLKIPSRQSEKSSQLAIK